MPTPKSPPPSLFVPCSLSLKASRILAYVKINFVGNILTGFHANTWPRPKISLCETCRAKCTAERGTNGTADNSWFPAHSLLFFFAPFFFFRVALFIASQLSGFGFVCFLRNHRQHFATSTQRHITSCTAPPPPRSASLCCCLFCISHIW